MTRDSSEFSLALVVGALAGAALALTLRGAARNASASAGDGSGDAGGPGGWSKARSAFRRATPRPVTELSEGPRRMAARAIRIPAGVRAVLGNGSRR